jgi:hypothetical protein
LLSSIYNASKKNFLTKILSSLTTYPADKLKKNFLFLLFLEFNQPSPLTVKDATRRASAVARWAILDIAAC